MKSLRRRIAQYSIGPSHYIFAAVFLLRLLVLVRLTSSPFLLPSQGDMHFYNDWALRILHGQWTDHQAFYGLPLYPYLLAGIYKVFGFSPFLPGLLQACLEGGTAVLLYKLAVKIFGTVGTAEEIGETRSSRPASLQYRGEAIGIAAAAGWAFFQPAEAYSVILMPTVWLVFVFWFVVWQIVNRREAPKYSRLLLLGGLVGFTAMGVATILFVIPLLLAALFLRSGFKNGFGGRFRETPIDASSRQASDTDALQWPGSNLETASKGKPDLNKRPAWATRLIGAAMLVIGVAAGMSPSFLHNYIVARDPVLLSAHSGVNFWIGNNPSANGYPQFPPGLRAGQESMLKDSITQAETAAGHPLKRSEVSAYWSAKARGYIRQNPGSWLKLLLVKIRNFWNAFQYDDLSIVTTLREEGVIFPGLGFGIIAALAIPGLLLAWVAFPLSRWVAAAVLLHMLSLLSVFVTERYRLAAVPGLLLFASFGLWELWQTLQSRRYRRAFAYSASLAVTTWLVSMPQRDSSLWGLDSYNTGLQALNSDHLDLAEKKLARAYAYVPENAEINFALGNLRFAQGSTDAAKSYYSSTLRLDSHHEGAYNNLGVLALQEGHWKLAARLFEKALEQDPRDAKVHYLLAQAHFKQSDLKSARTAITEALKLNPNQPAFNALRDEILKASRP